MFMFRRISSRGEMSSATQQRGTSRTPLKPIMALGEVREPTEDDFAATLRLFDDDEGWKLVHERDGIKVFNMRVENCPLVLMKACASCWPLYSSHGTCPGPGPAEPRDAPQ